MVVDEGADLGEGREDDVGRPGLGVGWSVDGVVVSRRGGVGGEDAGHGGAVW
jgi:hypothetical protein